MEITPYFGGTMNIMKMFEDDLPDELPDQKLCFEKDTSALLDQRYPIRWYDIEVEGKFASIGRPLSKLPFRSTIYVLGTGSNISVNDPQNTETQDKRVHPIAFLRRINPFTKRLITKSIMKEFGMK